MCLVLSPTSDLAAPAWIGYAGSRAKEGMGRGEEVVVRGGEG